MSSNADPFDLKLIRDRLEAEVAQLRVIGGPAEFKLVSEKTPAVPAAYVLPAREVAGRNDFMQQLVEQEVALEFEIYIGVRNLADDAGEAALESLRPVRGAIRKALLGWAPDADTYNVEFVRGEFAAFDADNVLWWTDTYRTAYLIRSA